MVIHVDMHCCPHCYPMHCPYTVHVCPYVNQAISIAQMHPMLISIKCTDGMTKTVHATIDDALTVKDLKKMIEESSGIGMHRICLKKDGMIMRDHVRLCLYEVLDGQELQFCYDA